MRGYRHELGGVGRVAQVADDGGQEERERERARGGGGENGRVDVQLPILKSIGDVLELEPIAKAALLVFESSLYFLALGGLEEACTVCGGPMVRRLA